MRRSPPAAGFGIVRWTQVLRPGAASAEGFDPFGEQQKKKARSFEFGWQIGALGPGLTRHRKT